MIPSLAIGILLVVVVRVFARLYRPDWWEQYTDYMRSRQWYNLRHRIIERDGYTCQDCGEELGYLEVHHLRYRQWWWYALRLPEPRQNLVCLCRHCHAERHGKER